MQVHALHEFHEYDMVPLFKKNAGCLQDDCFEPQRRVNARVNASGAWYFYYYYYYNYYVSTLNSLYIINPCKPELGQYTATPIIPNSGNTYQTV